ncbi:MAG: hypothetical protein ACI8QC_000755 [Planctomycetota bacterium]|jgi:hypothetical protein
MRFLLTLTLAAGLLLPDDALDLPYADAQDKAAVSSPLTLVALHDAGSERYRAQADKAAANIRADAELVKALRAEAKAAGTALTGMDLMRLAAYESGASKACVPDDKRRIGLFQLSPVTCRDVRIPYTQVDEASEWRKHAEAGRKLYVRLYKSLRHHLESDHGLVPAEVKLSAFHLYLAHRTSAQETALLIAQVLDGSSRTQLASPAFLAYLHSDPRLETLIASKHDIRAIEAYAYLLGGWSRMLDAITLPPTR